MNPRFYARPFPTTEEVRAKYAETRSVPITAARCGVSIESCATR